MDAKDFKFLIIFLLCITASKLNPSIAGVASNIIWLTMGGTALYLCFRLLKWLIVKIVHCNYRETFIDFAAGVLPSRLATNFFIFFALVISVVLSQSVISYFSPNYNIIIFKYVFVVELISFCSLAVYYNLFKLKIANKYWELYLRMKS